MFVITENTESKLLANLKELWAIMPTQRCLHLQFSKLETDIDQEKWFSDLLDTWRSCWDDEDCGIYLCFDHDVFLTTKFLTHKKANEFMKKLAPYFAPNSLEDLFISSLYVTSVHYACYCELIS